MTYRNSTTFAVLFILLSTISGCQSIIRGNAELYEINISKIPKYSDAKKGQQSIQLLNALKTPTIVKLSVQQGSPSCDLQQLNATAIELLHSALKKRSITSGLQSKKEVTLSIHHIKTHVGYWVRRTSLKLDAKLSNGRLVNISTEYRSPGDSFRALNGTIRRAVENLMNHKEFISYINS